MIYILLPVCSCHFVSRKSVDVAECMGCHGYVGCGRKYGIISVEISVISRAVLEIRCILFEILSASGFSAIFIYRKSILVSGHNPIV